MCSLLHYIDGTLMPCTYVLEFIYVVCTKNLMKKLNFLFNPSIEIARIFKSLSFFIVQNVSRSEFLYQFMWPILVIQSTSTQNTYMYMYMQGSTLYAICNYLNGHS